jgi:integrase
MGVRHYGDGSIYQRQDSPYLWIEYWVNGKPYRESTGTADEAEANKILRQRIAERSAYQAGLTSFVGPQRTPLTHLLDALLDDYRIHHRGSLSTTSYRLASVRRWLETCTVGELIPSKLRWYVARRMDEGVKNATINRELAAIKRAMNLGKAEGLVRDVPDFPMLPEQNVRRGFFDDADFERVTRFLPDYLQDLARFAYLSGWRRGDMTGLTWDDIDVDERLIVIDRTKEGEPRVLPLEGELWAIIERRLAERTSALWVFHRQGQRIYTFRKAWKTACQAAGMEGKRFHDFRRSAVRNLTRAGVADKVAMDMTGHKTRSVFDRYNITSVNDLREAVRKIARKTPTSTPTLES